MLTGRISKRLGITKGSYKVLVVDFHRIRPRACRHRQNLHVKPPGLNIWVMIEFKEILEVLKRMV